MNGLDAAGKTTVLYQLKRGEVITTIPTIGINVETLQFNNIDLTCWDVGGRDKGRVLWRHYFDNTNGLIWVIDSTDRDRIEVTKDELYSALNEEKLRDIPVLILCNKQDIPNAMTVSEIIQRLEMHQYMRRRWQTQACCATTGDGLYEGLDWLSQEIQQNHKYMSKRKEYLLPFTDDDKQELTTTQNNKPFTFREKVAGFLSYIC